MRIICQINFVEIHYQVTSTIDKSLLWCFDYYQELTLSVLDGTRAVINGSLEMSTGLSKLLHLLLRLQHHLAPSLLLIGKFPVIIHLEKIQ